ncbi:MAG: insulinase family protein [Flavobacteriaceae bacterium]|nr:insulinase family protein [Flavobacteriaceae bacterium]
MKTTFTTIIALFLLSLGVTAQIDRTKQPKPGPAPTIHLGKTKSFELKNGLKVIVVENHKLPKVSATLRLDNGPIFEGEKAGISSIFGKMIGNGTNSISKDEFNERLDFLGASFNIGSQSAGINTLSKYFPEVLGLIADAIKNPLLTQEEFIKQQSLTVQELSADENSVEAISGRVQNILGYGLNHPYGEFTSEASAKSVTLEDVKAFYETYFIPNNAYLVIIGDVNYKKIKKIVKKQFGDWKKGALPAYVIPTVENVAKTEINFVNMPNAVQSSIALLNAVDLKMGDPDYIATRLASKIFGGGGDARLFLNLREDKGYTYGAYSRFGNNQRTATLIKSFASVRNMVTDSAVVEFIKEIKIFRDTKVTDEELKNAKASYVGNFVMALEKPATAARYALNTVTRNLPKDFYETYLQKINSVTIDDIQRIAKKYYTAEQTRIVIVGKAIDVLPNLEKLPYTIRYFDKQGKSTGKPEMTKPIPAGITKETVINNYFEAIGGKDMIASITSTMTVYETEINGAKVIMTEKRTATDQLINMTMNGSIVMKVTANNKGVSLNGNAIPPALAKEMTALGTFTEFSILNNTNSSLSSIEMVDGKEAFVIKTTGENINSAIYYAVKTGLKIKLAQSTKMGGRTQNESVTFNDYKAYNGIKFPTKMTRNMGPQKMSFTLLEVKINEDVSDADFK